MSLLRRLFGGGGGAEPASQVVEYEGFRITPQPVNEGGQYRIGALIEAEVDGVQKAHHLIRADLIRDLDEAREMSIFKARQSIDQLGHRLFDT